jgi:hypothetical protein
MEKAIKMEETKETYAVWLDQKTTPEALREDTTQAYLEVATKLRLKDGVHIQHENGDYKFWPFPKASGDLQAYLWFSELQNLEGEPYDQKHYIDRILIKGTDSDA